MRLPKKVNKKKKYQPANNIEKLLKLPETETPAAAAEDLDK